MTDQHPLWSEADSRTYCELSPYAVPERERQIAIISALAAEGIATGGDILDLCCGEGILTEALAAKFPAARIHANDGSETMLAAARQRAKAPERLMTRRIELSASDWRQFDPPLGAVVSSLAVHHLDGQEKRALFADLYSSLRKGGVFILADIIRPTKPIGHEIAAQCWDEEVKRRALAIDGTEHGFELFRRADWNHFRHAELDPMDKPSTLIERLDWLREAGFADIDVHWCIAGHVLISAWRL